jgi:hypothetical protein
MGEAVAAAPAPQPSAGPPERRSFVSLIPSTVVRRIIIDIIQAAAEVILGGDTKKKR